MQYAAHIPAIEADAEDRATFIFQTYLHLAAAMFAFVAIEYMIFQVPPIVEGLVGFALGGGYNWLLFLGLFVGASWIADRWARSSVSVGMQYAGLALYVAAEAVLFVPLIFMIAFQLEAPDLIPQAGLITLVVFAGLTGVVFITRKDFSFLRGILGLIAVSALGLIVASLVFGFTLGSVFAAVMVALAGGYILYTTSNILHHYNVNQHVAAALSLFAAVALMLWYVLILLSRRR